MAEDKSVQDEFLSDFLHDDFPYPPDMNEVNHLSLIGAGIGGFVGLSASLLFLFFGSTELQSIVAQGSIFAQGPIQIALTGMGLGAAAGGMISMLVRRPSQTQSHSQP
jgi:hypothetical protein